MFCICVGVFIVLGVWRWRVVLACVGGCGHYDGRSCWAKGMCQMLDLLLGGLDMDG